MSAVNRGEDRIGGMDGSYRYRAVPYRTVTAESVSVSMSMSMSVYVSLHKFVQL
jgi:hypothetical protein